MEPRAETLARSTPAKRKKLRAAKKKAKQRRRKATFEVFERPDLERATAEALAENLDIMD